MEAIPESEQVLIKSSKGPNIYVIENNICEVKFKEKVIGRGFFTKIQSFSNKNIPILIIANNLQDENCSLTDCEIVFFD